MAGALWGLALPNCHFTFLGRLFCKGGSLGVEGAIVARCGLWGAVTNCFSPDSQEGHSLSCHGFCSPILGLFTLVSAKLLSCHSAIATLSAELGTKGVRGVRSVSLPPSALLE